MPYIKFKDREDAVTPMNTGELNFALTSIVSSFIACQGLTYAALNDAIGALECAKLELYRRVVGPYEDTKLQVNGDVYHTSILP